jgi:hypothetical protein
MNLRSSLIYSLRLSIIIASLVGVTGCAPQESLLPFETIERSESSPYQANEPKLAVVGNSGEAQPLDGLVSDFARDQLRGLDYQENFGIAVFQGQKPSNKYGVEIQRVGHAGNAITVYAHFATPDPARARADVVTSPQHLIKVAKKDLHGKIEFKLNVDGAVIIQQTYDFP